MKSCAIAIILTLPGCAAGAAQSNLATLHQTVDTVAAVEAAVCQPPVPKEIVSVCEDVSAALVKAQAAVAAVEAATSVK